MSLGPGLPQRTRTYKGCVKKRKKRDYEHKKINKKQGMCTAIQSLLIYSKVNNFLQEKAAEATKHKREKRKKPIPRNMKACHSVGSKIAATII
jgi:hypothetical protein